VEADGFTAAPSGGVEEFDPHPEQRARLNARRDSPLIHDMKVFLIVFFSLFSQLMEGILANSQMNRNSSMQSDVLRPLDSPSSKVNLDNA